MKVSEAASVMGKTGGKKSSPRKGWGSATPEQIQERQRKRLATLAANRARETQQAVTAALKSLESYVSEGVATYGIDHAYRLMIEGIEKQTGERDAN